MITFVRCGYVDGKTDFYSICLISFVGPFLSTSINIAIPVMAGQFGVAPDRMSWVVTIFLMTTAAFLLPLGKVSDVHGRRRTYSCRSSSLPWRQRRRPSPRP